MSFTRFIEPRGVTFDLEGNPNSFGRVTFCAIGTTTKKDVWSDTAYTVLAENPTYFTVDGRLETDIFLGVGDYTVYYEKFNGSGDPKIAPDSDFSDIYNADVNGAPISPTIDGSKLQVNTITDLRSIAVPSAPVDVLSYSVIGDCMQRTYYWDPLSTAQDDYGSVIKATSTFTGRYKTKFSNVIDVREFGILPGVDSTKNSQLNSLITYVNTTGNIHTIYFPAGTYYFAGGSFAFRNKIILDDGAKFATTTGTDLYLNIQGDHEIRYQITGTVAQGGFTSFPVDMFHVHVSFTAPVPLNKEIFASWFGITDSGTPADYASALIQFLAVGPQYTKVINQNVTYNAASNLPTSGDIQLDANIAWNDGVLTIRNSKVYGIGQITSGADNIAFEDSEFDINLIRNGGLIGSSLDAIQGRASNTICNINEDITFNTDFTDNGNINYVHKNGLISADGNTVKFLALQRGDSYIFSGPIVTFDYTNINNFLPVSPTEQNQSDAIRDAVTSSFSSNGAVDLKGKTFILKEEIQIVNCRQYVPLHIKNGAITANAALSNMIAINDDMLSLEFKDVTVQSLLTNLSLLSLSDKTIANLNFKDCSILLPVVSSSIITTTSDNTITNMNIDNCIIHARYVVHDDFGAIANLQINNCQDIIGGLVYVSDSNTKFNAKGNKVKAFSNDDYWHYNASEKSFVSNNYFDSMKLGLYSLDDGKYFSGHVNDNTFHTITAVSNINFVNNRDGVKMIGPCINNNTFVGTLTASTPTVVFQGSGSYTSAGPHILTIKDSTCSTAQWINVLTKGVSTQLISRWMSHSSIGKCDFFNVYLSANDCIPNIADKYEIPINYFNANIKNSYTMGFKGCIDVTTTSAGFFTFAFDDSVGSTFSSATNYSLLSTIDLY